MIEKIKNSPLFSNITPKEIETILSCSKSKTVKYQKESFIFLSGDIPKKLFLLVDGKINICRDELNGKRKVIATISKGGELFGEIFLFLNKSSYDNYAVAVENSVVIEIPKEYLYSNCSHNCNFHKTMISNLMSIFAQKAYYLNQKLNILSSNNLRQKICKLLLSNHSSNGEFTLKMNREDLADFLNVARPSLSRELMKMKNENLIKIVGKKIFINNFDKIKEYL